MDDIIYKWLPDGKAVQMDKQIEIPQFELVSHNLSDCSQNYTTGMCSMECQASRCMLPSTVVCHTLLLTVPGSVS